MMFSFGIIKCSDVRFLCEAEYAYPCFSAITMKRSYKDARSYEDAIGILQEVKGTQLDSDLVDMFCKIPKNEIEACVPSDVDVLNV